MGPPPVTSDFAAMDLKGKKIIIIDLSQQEPSMS